MGGCGEEGAATVAVYPEDDCVILIFDFSELEYGSRGCTIGICNLKF